MCIIAKMNTEVRKYDGGRIGADLCQTTAIERVFLWWGRWFLTEPIGRRRKKVCSGRQVGDEKLRHLAYAAFHCSSLRTLAASTSDCVTKREPTTPVEIEGIASSAMMEENPELDSA